MAITDQNNKVVGEKNLTSSFPNFRPFDTATSVTLFDMGTTRVTTNLVPSKVQAYKNRIVTTAEKVTLEDLRINSLEKARIIRQYSDKILLRPDRTDFTSYSYFGSLVELLRVSINDVIKTWPGSLFVNPEIPDIGRLATVLNLTYNKSENVSSFDVPVVVSNNRFKLNLSSVALAYPTNDLRNLAQEFTRYCIGYNEKEYPIIGFSGQTSTNAQYLHIEVKGQVFADAGTLNAFARAFHIQPNGDEIGLYLRGKNDLTRYLLNTGSEPRFTSLFRYPGVEDEDMVEQYVTWPSEDGFNPDFDGGGFGDYQDLLFALAQTYDNHKTNLLIRRLVPSSLLDYDQSYSGKMSQLLQSYAREFDKVKAFIDGIAHVNTVTYDRRNNAPDALIQNLARTLGWDTFPIVSDETGVVDALFNATVKHGDTKLSPAEVDSELWRRVVLNSTWLLQSKGTRQSLEAILGLIGAPDALIEFNEYIYLADKRIRIATDVLDISEVNTITEELLTLTEDVFTDTLQEDARAIEDSDFDALTQESELETKGNFVSKNIQGLSIVDDADVELPLNLSIASVFTNPDFPTPPLLVPFQNQGGNDDYIQAISDQGFNLKRLVDNKKAWTTSTGTTRSHERTETRYEQGDSRMVVNSKEVGINLNPARAVEYDVYSYISQFGYPIGWRLAAPYPTTTAQTDLDFGGMGFFEFTDKVYERFIDAKTRKISRSYPTLNRIYQDYLRNAESVTGEASSALTTARILSFTSRVGTAWNQLIDQMLPATTILTETGLHVRNTVFDTQKFAYKPGVDAGSEFFTRQPANAKGIIYTVHTQGSIQEALRDTMYMTEMTAKGSVAEGGDINTSRFSIMSTKMKPQPKCNMKVYSFVAPEFSAKGATKISITSAVQSPDGSIVVTGAPVPVTGTTEEYLSTTSAVSGRTHIHILSQANAKRVTFTFTPQEADRMRGASGATFGYLVFKFSPTEGKFLSAPIYREFFGANILSGGTMGTPLEVTGTIGNGVLEADQHYLIKGFFNKTISIPGFKIPAAPTEPLSYYEDFTFNQYPKQFQYDPKFYNRSTQVKIDGVNLSTEPTIPALGLNKPYGIYEATKDFYFATVGTPDTPIPRWSNPALTTTTEYFSGSPTTSITKIAITKNALKPVDIYRNGVKLVKDAGYTNSPGFVGPAIGIEYTLTTPLLESDIIQVQYYTDSEVVGINELTYRVGVSGVTAGASNSSASTPFYNTASGQLEILLPETPLPGSVSVQVNSTLYSTVIIPSRTTNTLFRLPSTVARPKTNDVIIVRYRRFIPQNNPFASLLAQPTEVLWYMPTPITPAASSGYFKVQFAENTDYDFTTILHEEVVNYIPNMANYWAYIDFNTVQGIVPGGNYLIRIIAHNIFSTFNAETVISPSVARIYKIRLGNLVSNPYGTSGGSTSGGSNVGFSSGGAGVGMSDVPAGTTSTPTTGGGYTPPAPPSSGSGVSGIGFI